MARLPAMRVVVAPDKFKGSLPAQRVAEAIALGWRDVDAAAEIVALPVADGGEGTAAILAGAWLGAHWREIDARDPLGRAIRARYVLAHRADGPIAAIDSSEASGLWRVAPGDRCPARSNTFGTGQLLAAADADGAGRVLLGLGGSGTNDGGAGFAAAIGYRFLDTRGLPFDPVPETLDRLATIVPPAVRPRPRVIGASDVTNPLLGPSGATRVYGPQKGVGPGEIERFEDALARLADVAARDLGRDLRLAPGAGAAGGLGFGLMTFCDAEIRPGFDLVAEWIGLEREIAGADLVITGEGSLDAQTAHGKAPAGVAALARRLGRPVHAIGGRCADPETVAPLFDSVRTLVSDEIAPAQAMRDAADLLRQRAAQLAREFTARHGSWLSGSSPAEARPA